MILNKYVYCLYPEHYNYNYEYILIREILITYHHCEQLSIINGKTIIIIKRGKG